MIDENAEVPGPAPREDKTGISTPKAATKKAKADAPKKSQGKGTEETIPAQETPAEEIAREQTRAAKEATQARASNPFAGDEDGREDGQDGDETTAETPVAEDQAEKPKSIFSFGPKKSAG